MTYSTRVSAIANLEVFLLKLRYKEGRLFELEGNRPQLLDDPQSVWIVYSGAVDVFSVPVTQDEITGARHHLFRARAGQALFGFDHRRHTSGLGLLAAGLPRTRVLRLPRSHFQDLANELEYQELVQAMIEDWVATVSAGMADGLVAPKDPLLLEGGETFTGTEAQVLMPKRGLVWLQFEAGSGAVLGRPELSWGPQAAWLPLTQQTWLQLGQTTACRAADTASVLALEPAWASLVAFQDLALTAASLSRSTKAEDSLRRLYEKNVSQSRMMKGALQQLASPLESAADLEIGPASHDGLDPLMAAGRLVGQALGISITAPARSNAGAKLDYRLIAIARASHIQVREVALGESWWQRDNGPLLGFSQQDQRPLALLPRSATRYDMVDPAAHTRAPVTPEAAARISSVAYTFYRPLPNRIVGASDLLKVGLQGNWRDIRTVLALGLGISLLGLVPPIATGYIFDSFIPTGDLPGLLQAGGALFLIALLSGLLYVARGIAMMRVQTKMDAAMQAAIWDRLLNLPMTFFARFTSGDLGVRAMGISELRRVLSGFILTTVLNSLFSFANLALLFAYSTTLALVALGMVAVALAVTVVVGTAYVRAQRVLNDLQGTVSGLVLQLLTGIVKFRVAGAESHAFAAWAGLFSQQKRSYYQARLATDNLVVFNAVFPLAALLVVFGVVAYSSQQTQLSTGAFMAFNLAFVQFLMTWTSLGAILVFLLRIVPVYEAMRPVLSTTPEVDETKRDPGELSGEIEVSHISFRYKEQGPFILKDISFHVQPGEFVAFVGASGSGKTTLMRLLLGLDRPESGGLYYDRQDITDLDLHEIRRQVGVVMQNATVMSGDIHNNIVGSWSNLSIDDAWEAARMAGLADDISKLPMGMNTVISERGSNLSGGQRQRLLIARAIVNRPRILLFDEATSALDNETQAIVSRSLEGLRATRIVIAHRLSTIMNADRIYVFSAGQIVQVGTYSQLVNQPGLFADLARRQMV